MGKLLRVREDLGTQEIFLLMQIGFITGELVWCHKEIDNSFGSFCSVSKVILVDGEYLPFLRPFENVPKLFFDDVSHPVK